VRPQIVLWRLVHTHVYANVEPTTHGSFTPGVIVLRFMGSIYFGNCSLLSEKITQIVDTIACSQLDDTKFVVVSLSACICVDTSAIHALEDVHQELHDRAALEERQIFGLKHKCDEGADKLE